MGILAAALLLLVPAQDVQTLLESAAKKLKARNFDAVLADCDRALGLDPKSAEAWSLRGRTHDEKGDWAAAEKDFTRALEIDPRRQRDLVRRGAERRTLKDSEGALRDLEEALRLKPGDAWALHHRGIVRYELNENEAAVADFTKALEDAPDYPDTFVERAKAQCRLHRYPEAIEDCSRAIKLDPKLVSAWNQVGIAKHHQKDYEGAILDYTEAIRLAPSGGYLYRNRGLAKADAGKHADAILDFSRAIDLNPKVAAVWADRGASRRRERDYPGAISDFTRALELSPSAEVFRDRSEVHRMGGNSKGAVQDAERAVELEPKNPMSFLYRGIALEARGDLAAAIRDFDEALRLNPQEVNSLRERGYCRSIQGGWEDGSRDLEGFFKQYPDTFLEVQVMLYLNRVRSGDPGAEAWLRKRISSWPKEDAVAHQARFLLGQTTEVQLLGALDEEDAELALYFVGMRKLLANDLDGAAVAFKKLASAKPRDFHHPAAKAELERLATMTRRSIEVRNGAPEYRLTLPAGYVKGEVLPQRASHAFVRAIEDPSGMTLAIAIEPLGGRIGREGPPKGPMPDQVRRALPPGAELRLGKTAWGEHQVDTFEARFFVGKEEVFSWAAQIPLAGEAIQIAAVGPVSHEAQVRKDLLAVLASLKGRSDWETPREASRRMASETPAWIACFALLTYVFFAVSAFRGEPLRIWQVRFWWLAGAAGLIVVAGVAGIVLSDKGAGIVDLVPFLFAALGGILAYRVRARAVGVLALAAAEGKPPPMVDRKNKEPLAPWAVFFLTWFGILFGGMLIFQVLAEPSIERLTLMSSGLTRMGFFIGIGAYFVARTNVKNWEKKQDVAKFRERKEAAGERRLCRRCGISITGSEQAWQRAGFCSEKCMKVRSLRPPGKPGGESPKDRSGGEA